MKLRKGFVSNSSSSSFMIVITKEAFDKAYSNADKNTQVIVDALGYKKKKLGSQELVAIGTHSDMGGGSEFDYLDLPEGFELPEDTYAGELHYEFIQSIPEEDCVKVDLDW